MKTIDYGHEGQYVEFKASFVHSADHTKNARFMVFTAACAMMNAAGGKIYIGISDRKPNGVFW